MTNRTEKSDNMFVALGSFNIRIIVDKALAVGARSWNSKWQAAWARQNEERGGRKTRRLNRRRKETNSAALTNAIIRYGPLVTIAVRPLSVLIS